MVLKATAFKTTELAPLLYKSIDFLKASAFQAAQHREDHLAWAERLVATLEAGLVDRDWQIAQLMPRTRRRGSPSNYGSRRRDYLLS